MGREARALAGRSNGVRASLRPHYRHCTWQLTDTQTAYDGLGSITVAGVILNKINKNQYHYDFINICWCRLRDCSATPRPYGTAVAKAPASNLARRPSCRTRLVLCRGFDQHANSVAESIRNFFLKWYRLRDSNAHHNQLFRKRLSRQFRRVTRKVTPRDGWILFDGVGVPWTPGQCAYRT
jgi:hypothetical protein